MSIAGWVGFFVFIELYSSQKVRLLFSVSLDHIAIISTSTTATTSNNKDYLIAYVMVHLSALTLEVLCGIQELHLRTFYQLYRL